MDDVAGYSPKMLRVANFILFCGVVGTLLAHSSMNKIISPCVTATVCFLKYLSRVRYKNLCVRNKMSFGCSYAEIDHIRSLTLKRRQYLGDQTRLF